MPYTILGKNAMVNALTALATHCGLLTATAATGVTGAAATNLLTKAGAVFADGNLVMVTLLVAEGAGLYNDVPYYVVSTTGNDFSLSETPAGAAIDFTSAITDCTVTKYVELTGGSPAYARKAISYNSAVVGSADDSTNGVVFDVGGASYPVVVNAVGAYGAITAGICYAIDPVTQESYGGQGTYTVSDADLDLNGDRVAA